MMLMPTARPASARRIQPHLPESICHSRQSEKDHARAQGARTQTPANIGKEIRIQGCSQACNSAKHWSELYLAEKNPRAQTQHQHRKRSKEFCEANGAQEESKSGIQIQGGASAIEPDPVKIIPLACNDIGDLIGGSFLHAERAIIRKMRLSRFKAVPEKKAEDRRGMPKKLEKRENPCGMNQKFC